MSVQTIRSSFILSSLSPLITTTSIVQVPKISTSKAEIASHRNQNARHPHQWNIRTRPIKLVALCLTVGHEKIYMTIKKWSLLLKRITIWLQRIPWLTTVNSRFRQRQLSNHLDNRLTTNLSSDSLTNAIANPRWSSTRKRWHSASLFNNWLGPPNRVKKFHQSINTSISM